MTNVDKIVEHVLQNSTKLSAERISAIAKLVSALGGERLSEPNDVEQEIEDQMLDEGSISLSDIEKIDIEGVGVRDIKRG